MHLTLPNLKEGISWWLQKSKWPRDFHNAEYHELYTLKENGLSDSWWDKTVDRLSDWRATRPLSKAEIKERGSRVLPRLQKAYLNMCARTKGEPFFFDFRWEQIVGFYNLLANIKASQSPVFPSKLGHFIFPKLFIVMDNEATGIQEYQVFWESMCEAWSGFDEKTEAKQILSKEIDKYSLETIHEHYPFEIKIIELCTIGIEKGFNDHLKRNLEAADNFKENSTMQGEGVAMKRLDEGFSCEHCRFSIERLKKMAEKGGTKEMFRTSSGREEINIYEVNTANNSLIMRRSTGNLTNVSVKTGLPNKAGELKITALVEVHNKIHSGEVGLDRNEIDNLVIHGKRETILWGNYIVGLLRHLGCRKIA